MQTATDREVGQVMRRIRFLLGERTSRALSQAAFGAMLAEAMKTTPYGQPTVSAWEKGETPVPGKALATALKMLGDVLGRHVPYEELLPEFKKPWIWAADAA